MNEFFRKKYSATTIEMFIIVVILLGLVFIATPNLFNVIDRSKGAEALMSLATLKSTVEDCLKLKKWVEGNSCTGCPFHRNASTSLIFVRNVVMEFDLSCLIESTSACGGVLQGYQLRWLTVCVARMHESRACPRNF